MVNREVIGIISGIDKPDANVERVARWLKLAGCKKIFPVCAITGQGLRELIEYLETDEERARRLKRESAAKKRAESAEKKRAEATAKKRAEVKQNNASDEQSSMKKTSTKKASAKKPTAQKSKDKEEKDE